jgi:hypothetical protein
MSDTISIDIQVGSTGAIPTPPATIRANLLAYIQTEDPTYTDLPAALVEDFLSTAVPAITLLDSCAIDLINSLTPDGSNPWLLTKIGQLTGVQQGTQSLTSVYVVFNSPSAGLFIPQGFTVSDGTYQYVVQDGGVVQSGGSTVPLYCLATQQGTWAVPVNSVTTLITSAPTGYTVTVTNPSTGIPGGPAQTEGEYRAQVMQAQLASATGTPRLLKTLLANVPGVQTRLISPMQINGGGWEIIVGGGDPYAVAAAIYNSGIDVAALVGSTIAITNITQATLGVVMTNLNHGLTTGQSNVYIAGVVGMTGANGGPYTVTVTSPKTFTFGVNTSGFGAYVSGGRVTPNARNIVVNLIDYPDTYTIPFVVPPQQNVVVQGTWNTDSPNIVSPSAVQQLAAPAIASYINGLVVGAPINLFQMNDAFKAAVTPIIPPEFVSRLVWTVSINGVDTAPVSGTGLIYGDPESFFQTPPSGVSVTLTQG